MTCLPVMYQMDSIKVSHHKTRWRFGELIFEALFCHRNIEAVAVFSSPAFAEQKTRPRWAKVQKTRHVTYTRDITGCSRLSCVSKFGGFGNSFSCAYLGGWWGHHSFSRSNWTMIISCKSFHESDPSRDHVCFHHLRLHHLSLYYLRCTRCKGEGLTCTHTWRNRGHLNALWCLYLKGLTCHRSERHLYHDSLAGNLHSAPRDKGNDTCSAGTFGFAKARPRSAILHCHNTTRHRWKQQALFNSLLECSRYLISVGKRFIYSNMVSLKKKIG